MRIGEVLVGARERAGLDLAEVEERTKIRGKYLRALEHEEWDELPSGAYAKGFLRSYARLLGLDAETMVDEFRRQVEGGGGDEGRYPLGDAVLEGRRPQSGGRPSPWLVLAVVVGIVVAVLAVIGLAGDDDDAPDAVGGARDARNERSGGGAQRSESAAARTVTLGLAVKEPVEVCLLGDGGGELIDGQLLAPATSERWTRKGFDLRFSSGFEPDQIVLRVDGERHRLDRAAGPVSYRIEPPGRVRERAAKPSRGCP